MSLEPHGIKDILDEEYRKTPGINISNLKHIRKNPKWFKYVLENGIKVTPDMEKGTAAHMLLLQPELFEKTYVKAINARRNSTEWKAFEAKNRGKILLKPDEWDSITAIIGSVKNHSIASSLLAKGESEQACFLRDKKTNILMKGKVDHINLDDFSIIDFKTTSDIDKFTREVGKNGIHIQQSWYKNLVEILMGEKVSECFLIVAETKPPYDVDTFKISHDVLELGSEECRSLLDTYHKCQLDNYWPGRSEETKTLHLEDWYTPSLNFNHEEVA